MRTRVKICGITRAEDAAAAVASGADAIGLVFYAPSPRAVDIPKAQAIACAIPAFVSVVALFVNAEPSDIREVLQHVPVDLLQFHGDEPPEECALYGYRYIKAIRMRADIDLPGVCEAYRDSAGLLLDAYHEALPGGSGESFDWQRIPQGLGKPVILAGGLKPENVQEAIRAVRPYAVDVSSGVERAKGIKDPEKISAFIRGVRSVESN